MLSPEYLDHIADDLLELYNQLDALIMRDIARRLAKAGNVTDTAAWQFDRLKESGLLHDDVVAQVARYADTTGRQIKALFEEAGIVSTDMEITLYAKAGIKARSIRMSPAALEILKAGIQKTGGELHNLTMTTAITTQQAYINAATMAEMQVESGLLDYQTAIRRAISEAAQAGASVSYPSGHIDKLDVAVRRAVLTGVNQTMGKVSLQYANEFWCDIMEITAHSGARPSHAVWQGQLVSRSGKRGYLSLDDIGYGTGGGFMGWNCRHSWNPFFEGISSRNYTPEKLRALNAKNVEYNGEKYTEYEISQFQRKMEREIRATKRELAALDEAKKSAEDEVLRNGLQADFSKASVKLKEQERALKNFLRETGSLPDSSRVQVLGFGRSQAQKAVWADKKVENAMKTDYNRAIESAKKQIAEMPKKLNAGSQNKHIRSSKGYIEGRSYIYGTLEDAQALVNRYSGTGTPKLNRKSEWTSKEFMIADTPIGIAIDPATGKEMKTRRFCIHYGKHGTHIIPVNEEA